MMDFRAQADHRPLIVDSFAGGGGASTGIEMALGRSPDIAINHNPAALALHAANHPDTLHLSENVWQVDPLDYVRGRHVGLAWFSPDCKHFSKAKGGKPVERNIRDLAWVVILWAQRARPDVILLENVEEFRDWGPLMEVPRDGRNGEKVTVLMPDPEARGQTFQKWLKQLRKEGYKVEWKELRACDYGAPTIRKRLFLIARCDGLPIVWPEPTHGRPDDPQVISGVKRPWRVAAEIIDWTLACPSIFATGEEIMGEHGLRAVRPLADATMSRVARGVKRYVLDARKPFLVNLTHGVRTEPVDQPFDTITGAHRGEKAIISPSLVSVAHGDSGGRREYSLEEPFGVVTAGGIGHAVVAPSVIKFQTGSTGSPVDEPLHTITANSFKKKPGGAAPVGILLSSLRRGLAPDDSRTGPNTADLKTAREPVVPNKGGSKADRFVTEQDGEHDRGEDNCGGESEPIHGFMVGDTTPDGQLVVPTLIGCGGRAGQSRPRGGDEPMATQTAKADVCVATAFIAQNNTDVIGREAEAPLSTIVQKGSTQSLVAAHLMTMRNAQKPFQGADEPTHTITAGGAGQTLVNAFVSRQFGASIGHGLDEPSATVTAGVNKSAIVAPFMQKYYGTGDGARADDPMHYVTTEDRFGFVEGEVGWPPFTEVQAVRARQVAAFLRAHGFWDEREFVTLAVGEDLFTIVDIGMRMLTPRELFSAQGFPPDYIIDLEFNGKPLPKDAQISCCGNSVSPPMAAALAAANCGNLAAFQEAAE
jgi:DNA (cytosine-5)-methyltransferase 1